MKVYLIRHSQPDFKQVDQAGYVGYGRDLTRLTPYGIRVAQKVALNPIFDEMQLLLVSPYTRTMQTAMEFAKKNPNLPTQVELLLHEWRPDLTGRKLTGYPQVKAAFNDYLHNTHHSNMDYETAEQLITRVKSVLDKYKDDYDCIGCVTHGQVIRRMMGLDMHTQIPYCGIYELDYK
jgi:Fructose-2,6-bisphosphatase